MRPLFAIALLALSFPGTGLAADLPVVGLDSAGKAAHLALSDEAYAQTLRKIIAQVQDSTLPALKSREESAVWRLRDVVVGVGVRLTAGLGPLYHVSAAPRIRLVYSNSTHPSFPE